MSSKWRILVVLAGLLLSVQASATIYKYIDKDGNLVLTDQKVPGAVPVVEHPVMTMPFPKSDGSAAAPAGSGRVTAGKAATGKPAATAASGTVYRIFISSPAPDTTFQRGSDQQVAIAVSVDPDLKAGLSLELLLDGNHFDGDALPLDQITRGTHTFSARIIDGTGKIIQDGPSNTFFVHQAEEKPSSNTVAPSLH